VAQRADPNPWGDRFRDPAVWGDRQALQGLADEALRDDGVNLAQLSPQVLVSLGVRLKEGGADPVPLLRAAQCGYPNDFWLNAYLGSALATAKQYEEGVGYCRVAVALRPDAAAAHYNLGVVLYQMKNSTGAIAEYKKAIALDPKAGYAHANLGDALRDKGDVDGAIAEYKKAITFVPQVRQSPIPPRRTSV
jgi:tetratricopeptide (TPR) repeat protein